MSEWIKCNFNDKATTPGIEMPYLIYIPNKLPNIYLAEFKVSLQHNIRAFLIFETDKRTLIKPEGIYYMPLPKPPETEG